MLPPARILIVEDDLALNEQISALLKKQHYLVHQCSDGEQGLSAALSLHFDLILLDVRLPERNGLSLLKSLRENKKNTCYHGNCMWCGRRKNSRLSPRSR